MTEDDSQKPKDFAERLRALRGATQGETDGVGGRRGTPQTPAGWVFRLSVELVAGLVVGGGIGWFLDRWLDTKPVMLLIFFALGAAAGMLNVIRAAKEMNRDVGGSDGK